MRGRDFKRFRVEDYDWFEDEDGMQLAMELFDSLDEGDSWLGEGRASPVPSATSEPPPVEPLAPPNAAQAESIRLAIEAARSRDEVEQIERLLEAGDYAAVVAIGEAALSLKPLIRTNATAA